MRRRTEPATLPVLPLLRRLVAFIGGNVVKQVLLTIDAGPGLLDRFERAVKADLDWVVAVGVQGQHIGLGQSFAKIWVVRPDRAPAPADLRRRSGVSLDCAP